MDEYKSKKDDNAAEDYEILLQKEEAAIRLMIMNQLFLGVLKDIMIQKL